MCSANELYRIYISSFYVVLLIYESYNMNENREQSKIAQSQEKPVMQRFMENLPTEQS